MLAHHVNVCIRNQTVFLWTSMSSHKKCAHHDGAAEYDDDDDHHHHDDHVDNDEACCMHAVSATNKVTKQTNKMTTKEELQKKKRGIMPVLGFLLSFIGHQKSDILWKETLNETCSKSIGQAKHLTRTEINGNRDKNEREF